MRINRSGSYSSQSGLVLLLVVLALLAIGGAVLFVNLGTAGASVERQLLRTRAANDTLLAAKLALIGYALSPPPGSGFRPGVLPIPDSYINGNYDGVEDSKCLGTPGVGGIDSNGLPGVSGSSIYKRCLGKFPWKTIGLDLGEVDQSDPTGRVPWLAVSANVVSYDSCLMVLNSDSASLDSPVAPSCPSLTPPYPQPATLPHPWLKVVDENGNELSKRVVAVLIMPGNPISTESHVQQRGPTALQPSNYIDDIKLPLGCVTSCTTFNNAGLTNVFVSIPPGTLYPNTAEDISKRGQKVPFNDILIYITIDELMPYIERRVVGEMSKAMSTFKATTNIGNYAWPAPFTTAPVTSTSFYAQPNTFFGVFPFMTEYSNGTNGYYYATDFNLSLPGATEAKSSTCARIQKTPNIYVRPSVESESFLSYAATPAMGQCQWKGLKAVDCSDTTTITRTVNVYSSLTNCTNLNASGTASITFARQLQVVFSGCTAGGGAIATPVVDVNRWNYVCTSNAVPGAIYVTDTLASYSPITGIAVAAPTVGTSLITGATSGSSKISNMRYLPILPDWYIDNLWYKTGFAALGPSFAPIPGTPCGAGIASLTVDNSAGVRAVVMQAGKYLGGTPGPRPSATIADYFEGNNAAGKGGSAPGMTDCTFSNAGTAPLATMNDQILAVSP